MAIQITPLEISPPEPSGISGSHHWLERAAEARAKAQLMTDQEARTAMLDVAAQYERLARWVEEAAEKTSDISQWNPGRIE